MVIMATDEVTWYEDGGFMEFWPSSDPKSRKISETSLKEAIRFAQQQKMVLVIQPAYQNECIFVDYTE